MKALVIDDSPMALRVAKARLAQENLDVICATDGAAGLALAHTEQPDIILLDVDMPDMSGFDVCKALKADGDLSMIPVIFVTGSTDTSDKVRGLDLGAVDYVTKPFDAFELRARVRAALRTKHLQDLLVSRAQIDPLTELWNRRAFLNRLKQEWSRAQRHGQTFSIIMADLDTFKRINDTHGHNVGDRVLHDVAQVLMEKCRDADMPARWGGEEFAVLVPSQAAADGAGLAERYRSGIEQLRIEAGENVVTITGSFGVADSTSAASPQGIIAAADSAMYRAKNAGRNRVAVFDPDAPDRCPETHPVPAEQPVSP